MEMEKFLFKFKLSKGSMIIGWLKVAISAVLTVLSLVAIIFSSALLKIAKNILSGNDKKIGETSEFRENSWNT
jgi:hypothetical protein